MCKSCLPNSSRSFVFKTLVCTRTLHPLKLLLLLPLPVSITQLFLKASSLSYLVQNSPQQQELSDTGTLHDSTALTSHTVWKISTQEPFLPPKENQGSAAIYSSGLKGIHVISLDHWLAPSSSLNLSLMISTRSLLSSHCWSTETVTVPEKVHA